MTLTPPNRRPRREPAKPFLCAWPQDGKPHILVDPEALRHPVLPLGRIGLRALVSYILGGIPAGSGARIGTWELRVTTDQPMARLHAFHLKRHTGPTNVLAFPAQTAQAETVQAGTADSLGFIVINADAIMREAYLYGQDQTEHFIRLLTHALLHLAGFEHGQAMDELTESVVQGFRHRESGQAALLAAQDVH